MLFKSKLFKSTLLKSKLFIFIAVLMLVLSGCAMTIPPVAEKPGFVTPGNSSILKFDVAEDMGRFAFDQTKVHEDGMPAHGSSFITQGYIYEYGTLTDSNGVNPDGSPEFPDKVLGEWTCKGWFVGEGAHAKSGPWVISTQIYNFGDKLGEKTLVTEGYELADFNVAIERAIVGGTGAYRGASGQGAQTLLGFNATEGVNLRLELNVATGLMTYTMLNSVAHSSAVAAK